MKRLLENTKYLMLAIVVASLAGTVAALVWGLYETVNLIISIFTNYKSASSTVASFVQLMDIFLVVMVLYIFTVTVYELFIGDLELPAWLRFSTLDDLKTVLSNMIILIAVVSFLKYFLERNDPGATLLYAVSVVLVSFALILYRQHGSQDKH